MKKVFTVLLLALSFLIPTTLFAKKSEIKFVFSKFEVMFYGYVKVDIIYDDSSTFFGNINLWANSEPGDSDNQFNITLNQTRLGFSIKGPIVLGGIPKAAIEMDFYGGGKENTPHPRLYRTFIEVKWPNAYFLAGQDWDTHSALYPAMLNFGYLGNAGNIQYRRPQIRFVKSFPLFQNSKISVANALARTIASDLDGYGINDGNDAGFPTYEGRLSYEHKIFENLPLTLAFSGHFGTEEVDWDAQGDDIKYNSWSLNGEAIIPIWKYAYLKGEFFYGSNLDAYFGGINQGINSTTREAIKARGGWAQLTLLPFNSLSFNAGAGVDNPYSSHLNDGDREKNTVIYGNVYYKLSSNFTAAFEYQHYRTKYKNIPDGNDNRYHAALIYGF